VERLKPEVEAVNQKATYGELTTFELVTALGFAHFNLKGVDFQVLEVGMGGRFDATNVIHPEVCLLSSISFDHTEVLGDSLAEIATEKVGIIMKKIIFIFAIFGMIVVASASTAFTALMKPMMDGSFVKRDPETIKLIPIAIIDIFFVAMVKR